MRVSCVCACVVLLIALCGAVKNIICCAFPVRTLVGMMMPDPACSDLAKVSPHVLTPELFAVHIGVFLLNKYGHLKRAYVDVERLRWSRIVLGGGVEEKHSFVRDGDEKHVARVEVIKVGGGGMEVRVTAGLVDLLGECG